MLHRLDGVDATAQMLRSRRGTEFDRELVDGFCANAGDLLASLEEVDGWDALINGHDKLQRELTDPELDKALEAFADYADVKSPYTLGHSRGLPRSQRRLPRPWACHTRTSRSYGGLGWVRDVGTIGVSSGILDKPGRLTAAERERVRTHPYLTARTFSRPAALGASGISRRCTTADGRLRLSVGPDR